MNSHIHWRPAAIIAIASTLTAATVFISLHFHLGHEVDPMRDPVSSYVLFKTGDAWFALGSLSLAIACAALAYGCLPQETGARRWLTGAFVALIIVTLFQTETTDKMSIVAQIHRYSAGAVFALITVAGAAVWYPRRHVPIGRILGLLTLTAAIAMTINAVNTLFPVVGGSITWRGIPQRVMLIAHAILLLMIPYLPAASRRSTARHLRPSLGMAAPRQPALESSLLWLTGRGGEKPRALLSPNGLYPRAVCRQRCARAPR